MKEAHLRVRYCRFTLKVRAEHMAQVVSRVCLLPGWLILWKARVWEINLKMRTAKVGGFAVQFSPLPTEVVVGPKGPAWVLDPKKQTAYSRKSLILLVPEIGVEPTTFALRMRCSTN